MLGLDRLNMNIAEVSTERLVGAMERVLAGRDALVAEISQRVEEAVARIDREVGSLLTSLGNGMGEAVGREALAAGNERT